MRSITVAGERLEEVDSFPYLGSVIDKEGGTDVDVGARIDKARAAFNMLRNIWKSKEIMTETKLPMLNRFSFMGQRRGDAQKRHYRRSKHS